MKLTEYLVVNVDTGEKEIIDGIQEACDRAWEMYQQDPDKYYVWVEDTFGDTVLEYGDIEYPDCKVFEHLGYSKPYDIIDDCYMSYNSMEVI